MRWDEDADMDDLDEDERSAFDVLRKVSVQISRHIGSLILSRIFVPSWIQFSPSTKILSQKQSERRRSRHYRPIEVELS